MDVVAMCTSLGCGWIFSNLDQVYVIRHGLGQQVCRLLSAPQKYLQCAAVRVLRAIIGTKELQWGAFFEVESP